MLLNFICIEKGLLHCRFWWMHHLIVMHNSLLTVEKTQKLNSNTHNKTKQSKLLNISHFQAGTQSAAYEHIMGCPVCNCIFCASSADACCQQAIGISLCGLEPNCLVIVQSVIFLFFFLFWQMGFSFFLFFHLKEIPCTCQMYCMKVITEPWRKYLNDALVMCCSDNSSFQSTTTKKR